MNYRFLTGLVFLLLITVSDSVVAESVLRFNPFHQPEMEPKRIDAGRKSNNALKLRGTVVDGEDSMVNIDGKFYRLYEKVASYRVVRIESGKVTLHRGVNETVLTLNDDDKKLR